MQKGLALRSFLAEGGQTQVLILAGMVIVIAVAGGVFFLGRVTAPKPPASPAPDVASQRGEQAPVASPQPSPTPQPSTTVPIKFENWQTYFDDKGRFSVQYPPNYKLSESTPGKNAEFANCIIHSDKKEVCSYGYSISIEDYDGGSRRSWFDKKFPNVLIKPYYEDMLVAGVRTLIIMDGNTGGSTGSYALLPQGTKMYFFSFPDGWNPETGDKSSLSFIKQVLSTFKFLP